jgi:hypothetical protein
MSRISRSYQGILLLFISVTLIITVPMGAFGASISGTVSDSDGSPINGTVTAIEVYLFTEGACFGGQLLEEASINATGNFSFEGLDPGSYYLQTSNVGQSEYVNEWYGVGGSSFDCNDASPVTINASDDNVGGIDFQLDMGGVITGTVTYGSAGIADVGVSSFGLGCDGPHLGGAGTESDGSYAIHGIPQGIDVYLWAHWMGSGFGYVNEWYDGADGVRECYDAVPVSAGMVVDFDLQPAGSLSGVVTADSSPVEDLYVYVVDYQDGEWLGGTSTAADGSYTINELPTGDYRVQACADCSGHPYLNEYYPDVYGYDEASAVTVVGGADTPNINFDLGQGTAIEGDITGLETDQQIQICANNYEAGSGDGYTGIGYCTGVTGSGDLVDHYTLHVAPELDYHVEFQPENGIYTQYDGSEYGTLFTGSPALIYAPVSGSVTGIDITLTQPVTISGTITDLAAGQYASINAQSDEGFSFYTSISGDGSGSDAYAVNVAPGYNYRVEFQPDNAILAFYLEGSAEGTYAWEDATLVTASENVGGIDITVTTGGAISGTVYQSDGTTPITGGDVRIVAFTGDSCDYENWQTSTWSDPDTGAYTIDSLPTGSYYLRTENNQESGYVNLWHDGAQGSQECSQAALVAVDSTGVDFHMPLGGRISGRVTSGGSPVAGLQLYANEVDSWMNESWAETDANGNYAIIGLTSGDYHIRTCAECNSLPLVDEYYDNVFSENVATAVQVSLGALIPQVDIDLEVPSYVSGTVIGLVPGAWVDIDARCDAGTPDDYGDDFWLWSYASADASGTATYSIPAAQIPGFAYRLSFRSDERLHAYYQEGNAIGAFIEAEATLLYPTNAISNVDIELIQGEPVIGDIHDLADGQEMSICAYGTDGAVGGYCTSIVGDGSEAVPYSLRVAPDFEYTIQFYPDGGIDTEYNGTENGSWDGEDPTPIFVPSGGSSGIDLTVTQAVTLGGTITGLDLDQYVNINATCDNGTPDDGSDDFGFSRSVFGNGSNSDTYAIPVGPGCSYRVVFDPDEAIRVYYQSGNEYGTTQWDAADLVAVDTTDINGIDVTISAAGSVSGRVINTKEGTGIESLQVQAFQGPCWNGFLGGAQTDADGYYQIDNLPPGPVYIRTCAQCERKIYIDRWWIGPTDDYPLDCEDALPVTVTANEDTGAIDFSLSGPGHLDWADMYLSNDTFSVELAIFPTFREWLTEATVTGPDGFFYEFDLEADLYTRENECNPTSFWYQNFPRPVSYGEYRIAVSFKDGSSNTIVRTIEAPTGSATAVAEATMSAMVNADGSIDLYWTEPEVENQTHRIKIYEMGGERIYKSDRLEDSDGHFHIPAADIECIKLGVDYRWRISTYNEEYQIGTAANGQIFTYDPANLQSRIKFFRAMSFDDDLLLSWDSRAGSRENIVSAYVSDPASALFYTFDLESDWFDQSTESRPFQKAWAFRMPPTYPIGQYELTVEFDDGYIETETATNQDRSVVGVDRFTLNSEEFDNGDMVFRWALPDGISGQRYQVRIRSLDESKEYFCSEAFFDTNEVWVSFWNLRELRQAGLYKWIVRVYTDDYSVARNDAAQTFLYNPFDLIQPPCIFDRDFDGDVDGDVDGSDIALMAKYLVDGTVQDPENFMADLAQSLGNEGCW